MRLNDPQSDQLEKGQPQRPMRQLLIGAASAVALLLCHAAPGAARIPLGTTPAMAPEASIWVPAQAQPPAAAPRSKAAPKRESAAPATDGQLRQRVEQLEEQLVDMQVLVGTLESLARGGGGAAARPAGGSMSGASEAARIDALETQVRAMTTQIEQLSQQLRQSGRRDEAPLFDRTPGRGGALMPPPGEPQATPSGFGSVTVTPQGGRDPIGQMIRANPAAIDSTTLPPPIADTNSPKELYETAHGYLLQRDYAASEAAFEEFLRRYPNDALTADAQYWMGETLFMQGRYKPAGQAFLKVVQQYRQSSKAPNSLLMLAMTLEQLGQKDCALFNELETRHPNAPGDVKSRARTLKQRVGC